LKRIPQSAVERTYKERNLVFFAVKAAAGLLALGTVGAAGNAELGGHAQVVGAEQSIGKVMYTVRPGDTLSKLAAYFCHDPGRYRVLAAANGIANPNMIRVGQSLWMACGGTGSSSSSISGSSYTAGSAVIPAPSSIYSYAGLERLWIAAGGSSGTASHAACIAEHESGGRPWAISPTNDWGLWQIHDGGYAMLNAFANAQRAIAMSGNGTNWSQWTTAGYC
jgi:hypothetical protein